jgi:hypothetical protein
MSAPPFLPSRRLLASGDLVIPASWANDPPRRTKPPSPQPAPSPQPSGIPAHQPTLGERVEQRELAPVAMVPLSPHAPPIPNSADFSDFIEEAPTEPSAEAAGEVGSVVVGGLTVPPPRDGFLKRALARTLDQLPGPWARQVAAARRGAKETEALKKRMADDLVTAGARPTPSQAAGDSLSAIAAGIARQAEEQQRLRELPRGSDADVAATQQDDIYVQRNLQEVQRELQAACASRARVQETQPLVQGRFEELLREKARGAEAYGQEFAAAVKQGRLPPAPSIPLTEIDSKLAAARVEAEVMPQIIAEHQAEVQKRQVAVTAAEDAAKITAARVARARFLSAMEGVKELAAAAATLLQDAESAARAASMSGDEGKALWREVQRLRRQVAHTLCGILPQDFRELRGVL